MRSVNHPSYKDAARVECRRFLDYWMGADAELPEVAGARAAVAR